MASRSRELIVGIFSLIGVIALIFLTIQIKGPLLEGKYRIFVRFEEVAGTLERGASILVYGVRVGEVIKIEIKPDPLYPDHPVVLELQVQNSMTLYENATVVIEESAIIGATTIIITPGTPSFGTVSEDFVLLGSPNTDIMSTISEQGPEIFFEVAQSVNIVNEFLEEMQQNQQLHGAINDLVEIISFTKESLTSGEGNVQATMQAIRTFTENLNQSLTLFNEVLRSTQTEIHLMRTEMTDAIDTLHIYSHDRLVQAGEIMDRIDRTLREIDSYAVNNSDSWEETTTNLASASAHLESLLARLDAGEGTAGLLLTDNTLHNEVVDLVAAIRRWIVSIDAWLSGVASVPDASVFEYDRTARPGDDPGQEQ